MHTHKRGVYYWMGWAQRQKSIGFQGYGLEGERMISKGKDEDDISTQGTITTDGWTSGRNLCIINCALGGSTV